MSTFIIVAFIGAALQNLYYFISIDINVVVGILSILGMIKICGALYLTQKLASS